jgi:hypothetical protein
MKDVKGKGGSPEVPEHKEKEKFRLEVEIETEGQKEALENAGIICEAYGARFISLQREEIEEEIINVPDDKD